MMTIGYEDFRLLSLIYLGVEILGLLTAVHNILCTRTAQGAIAWFFPLVLFPLLAIPLYWIFGRNKFDGYVVTRRAGELEIQRQVTEGLTRFTREYGSQLNTNQQRFQACERLADLPFTHGNRVELLVDGDNTFSAILEEIDTAKSYVLVQFFIIHDDEIGRQLKQALISKASKGVRVHLLYDEVGSHDLPRNYIDDLRRAGAEVFSFRTSRGFTNRFQINFRNHRKIVIVDGKSAFLGGHNVGDEYLGRNPKFGHWRDTHLKIEGPSVVCVQLPFVEDWHWATGQTLPDLIWGDFQEQESGLDLLVIPTGPADELTSCGMMFVHLINSARTRCWITSPYYVPSDEVAVALELAVLRGVDVRILVPDSIDHLIVYLSSFAFIENGLNSGLRFFRYQDGFLHQKVILIDDDCAAIGTANLDNRSFRLNFEITALVADARFASQVTQMLENDFANSREMDKGELSRKPFLFQLACQTSRLMAPIQ